MTRLKPLARGLLTLVLAASFLSNGLWAAGSLEGDARRLLSHSRTAAQFRAQLLRIRDRLDGTEVLTLNDHTYIERSAALYTRMEENMLEFVARYAADPATCPLEETVLRGAALVNRYENAATMLRLFENPLANKRYDSVAAQQDFVKRVRAQFADRRTAGDLLEVADALVARKAELGRVRDESVFGELMKVTLDSPSLVPVGEPSLLADSSRWAAAKAKNLGLRFGASVDAVLYGASKLFGNVVGNIRFLGKPEISGGNKTRILEELRGVLRPGDLLLDKTRFALTDRIIPGYWGHVAVWLGSTEEIRSQHLFDPVTNPHVSETAMAWLPKVEEGASVLEALRPGVEINPLEHFMHLDDVGVFRIRPQFISTHNIKMHLRKGLKWVGTDYDFGFDVNSHDRIVCSELVYQIYPLPWKTSASVGRRTISPDQVASLCGPSDEFPLELVYWARGEKRFEGKEAYRLLWQNIVDEGISIPEGRQGEAIRALGVKEKS